MESGLIWACVHENNTLGISTNHTFDFDGAEILQFKEILRIDLYAKLKTGRCQLQKWYEEFECILVQHQLNQPAWTLTTKTIEEKFYDFELSLKYDPDFVTFLLYFGMHSKTASGRKPKIQFSQCQDAQTPK
jgi:hypothetical protein